MSPDTNNYSSAVTKLLQAEVPYPLVPNNPMAEFSSSLSALDHQALCGGLPIANPEMASACLSGLWLRFDFLDRSHTISQNIHTATGSYWHGIMHRREPDWSNAKYWFNRVGEHEIFAELPTAASRIAAELKPSGEAASIANANQWNPFAFVDLCQTAHRAGGKLEMFCQQVQMAEWELLFHWCFRQAIHS